MKITVTFDLELPGIATDSEVSAWLAYRLGANGSLSIDNPLSDFDIEAVSVSHREF